MSEPRADTWMPLYVADYLKDTRHLSTLEHGAYFQLLMHAWTHDGLLPVDETRIARIAGLSAKEWRGSSDVILAFFIPTDDGYRHKRVDHELARAGNLVEQRRAAGKASAAARAVQRDKQQKPNGNPTGVATGVPTNGQRNGRPSPSQSQKVPFDEESNGGIDPEKVMFDTGISMLVGQGKSEAQARTLLGKWKRDHGCGQVIEMLGAAQRLAVVDIPSWAEGRWRASGAERQPVIGI